MASEREAELLRQIVASPDDLALRSVYADELQRRSDPRGDFIARQLAGDPARELVERHAASWWPGISPRRFSVRNGFIDRLAIVTTEVEATRALVEPIRELELLDIPLGALASLELARFDRITAHGATVRLDRHLGPSYRSLDLGRYLDWSSLTKLPACRELSFAHASYVARVLPKLLGPMPTAQLVRLDLSGTTLTPEALADVLKLDLSALVYLNVSANPLAAAGAMVLLGKMPPKLAQLDAVNAGFAPPDLEKLRARVAVHAEIPERIAIDTLGSVIELHRVDAERWGVTVDGKKRLVRWQSVASTDRQAGQRVTQPWQMTEHAPLHRIAEAVASGEPRQLTETGFEIDLGANTGYVYNSSVFTQDTAHVEFAARGPSLSVTFDSYTSID